MTAGPLRVGMTFDLRDAWTLTGSMPSDRYAELDSERTVAGLEGTLIGLGHRVDRIGGLRELARRLLHDDLAVDVVFNLAEGVVGRGREAQVPVLLEAFGVAYTGADPAALAITLDKALTKRLWRDAGLPTAPFQVVAEPADLAGFCVGFPCFVKPVAEGSSMGVDAGAVVHDATALRSRVAQVWRLYDQPALVEAFLPGREFTVGVVDRAGVPEVLGVAETAPAGGLRSYEAKSATSGGEGAIPFRPVSDARLRRELGDLALRAYRTVGGRDVGRVDLRCDGAGQPQLLEINALPGLAPDRSAMAYLAEDAGVGYHGLIATVLEGACRRHHHAARR